ncbi:Conserved_hypothetical protein [Hexamita inflata]|uniref:Uncharacterized protein n=1 Tax=Hexamita inflata TaxID=28002 RepID=A0AA86QPY8_9EUKA|nr:Conserved hypothetical protein [Hexamita inflata]
MDARQRRIAKIAQALIDEHLVDSEDQKDQDDDFVSADISMVSSDSSVSEGVVAEEEIGDVTESQVSTIQKAKKAPKPDSSARDILKQRLSKAVIKEQFKLSDEDWIEHMAVTSVWNRISREKAATQLAIDNMQYQEQLQEQLQQQKFTDIRPYYAYFQSKDMKYTLQSILELHFSTQAKYIMECLQNKVSPDEFLQKPESKNVPDDCDYKVIYDAYVKAQNSYLFPNKEKKVLKVSMENGKMSRFECIGGIEPPTVKIEGQMVKQQPQQQTLTVQQKYQLEMMQRQKDLVQKSVNTLYTRTFNTQPFRDQTGYQIIPNSKQTQTNVSYQDNEYWSEYRVISDPPKRGMFNKFYALHNGIPLQNVMNCQMQTDVIAKNVKGDKITDSNELTISINGTEFDIKKNEFKKYKNQIYNAKELKILKKGRPGPLIQDFTEFVRGFRPDLLKAESAQEVVQNGTWLTLDGMYSQKQGAYEVADANTDTFQIQATVVGPRNAFLNQEEE